MMMTLKSYQKPLPQINASNKEFWQSTKQHQAKLQQCQDCKAWVYPIAPWCQSCWSENIKWTMLSGRGAVSSWVVVRRSFEPSFDSDVPYVVAQIELEEGMRFISNVIDVPVGDYYTGMPVKAYYDDVTPDITLFKFRRA